MLWLMRNEFLPPLHVSMESLEVVGRGGQGTVAVVLPVKRPNGSASADSARGSWIHSLAAPAESRAMNL